MLASGVAMEGMVGLDAGPTYTLQMTAARQDVVRMCMLTMVDLHAGDLIT